MPASVPPTPPVPPQAAAATGTISGTGTVVQLPAGSDGALLQLQLQQALRGIVTSRTAQGTVTLQTSLGPVSVQTGLTPPPGASLTLIVQSLGPPLQVAIQPGASGQTQAQATPATAGRTAPAGGQAAGTPAPGSPAQAAQPVQMTLTQGSVLVATLTRPAASPGTPAAAGAAAQSAATPGMPAAPGTAAPASGTAAAPALLAALPAGSRVSMRLVGFQPPGTATGSAQAAAQTGASQQGPAGTVQALVTGAGTSGQTLLRSPAGQFSLATSEPLPSGTRLVLEPIGQPTLPTTTSAADGADGPRWDTLRDSVQAVLQGGSGAARMMQATPAPNPQLPASVIFFLQALRHGSLKSWIGDDAVKALGRQNKGLLDRLGGEFGQMQRLSGEPVAPDWRMFLIPLLADGEAEKLRLYLKERKGSQAGDDNEPEADRFVVEANFTRLGPFQFDGLVREKRLDLMIRTVSRLPADMQDGITSLFADTVSVLGFNGNLGFQVTDRLESPAGTGQPSARSDPDDIWA